MIAFTPAEWIAWLCLGSILLVYLGYPLWLMLSGKGMAAASSATDHAPPLTVMIVAHNEAAAIGEKLDSVLAAARRYSGDVQILVGDDASSDATASIAEGFAIQGVETIRCPRGGKAAALNRIIGLARHDIIVLTDADPLFEEQTLTRIAAPFAEPKVGAAAGVVAVIKEGKAGRFAGFDALFRLYENALRTRESARFGTVAADGGLFAIRRALFPHVPSDVTDDFYISTAARVAGYRIVQADDARVFEHSITASRKQFRRRVRITVRGMTGLWRRRALMNPFVHGAYAVALIMHKLARRMVPLLLLPLWLAAGWIALNGQGLSALFWGGIWAGLSLLVLAGLASLADRISLPRPLRMAQALALHLAGQIMGVLLFLCGRRYAQWTPQK